MCVQISSGSISHCPCFLGGSAGKESACNWGDLGSVPGLGRSPGEGHGHPLQYSCLESPHGPRCLEGYRPRGCKGSDPTECLSTTTADATVDWGLPAFLWASVKSLSSLNFLAHGSFADIFSWPGLCWMNFLLTQEGALLLLSLGFQGNTIQSPGSQYHIYVDHFPPSCGHPRFLL